ncbi:MAG: hypothetical protein LQ345_004106, partial [Seirophora villosa]
MYASKLRSSDGFIIFVVGVAVFTDMMLYGLLVPILPYVLSDRVGVPQEDVQKWNSLLLGSFGGALTIGSLVIGWIGDRVRSRQTPFLFGLIAVGLSTLAISLTRSITILLVARILQGFSGAVVSTVGYAILFDVVGTEKIGRAMGFVSMSQSFGLLVGPAVGGVLYEWGGGYFNTFIPAFVLIVLEIVLRGLVVVRGRKGGRSSCLAGGDEEEEEEEEEASSKASLLLATEGSDTNIRPHTHYGTTHDPDLENNNAQNPAANHDPTYPDTDTKPSSSSLSHNPSASTLTTLRLLLSTPRIPLALISLFLLNTLLTSYDAALPIHISRAFASPPSTSSLLFLTTVAPFLLVSPLAGHMSDTLRAGPALPATLGWALLTPGVWVLGGITSSSSPPSSSSSSPSVVSSSCANVSSSHPYPSNFPPSPQRASTTTSAHHHPILLTAACLLIIGVGAALALPATMADVALAVEGIEQQCEHHLYEQQQHPPARFNPNPNPNPKNPKNNKTRGGIRSLGFGIVNTAFAAGFFAGPALAGWVMERGGGWAGLGR